jgi:hypothetical protein
MDEDLSVKKNKLCPYFDHSFPNCYCVEMNSIKVARVTRFCRDRYWDCHIYETEKNRVAIQSLSGSH